MKKVFSIAMVLMLLLNCSAALADGMGVQLIGGPEVETEPVSLDDFKLGVDVEIEGYGILNGLDFSFVDCVYVKDATDYFSGNEAEYALLKIDIINTAFKPKDYLTSCEVRVFYDDEYEYGGWSYQCNYDVSSSSVLIKDRQFAIDPMYQGHYWFGCTLPNAVVNGTAPLRMVITLDGNEITYNIRN